MIQLNDKSMLHGNQISLTFFQAKFGLQLLDKILHII
jgi:hypothetical protein